MDNPKDTFVRRQFDKFKKDAMVSGTFYNMATFGLVTFLGTLIVLLVFRPPIVMYTPKPTKEVPNPNMCISWPSLMVWSLIMGAIVVVIAFFTRPKPSPAYVLEK
jgi:hypothetical protein